MVNLNTSRHFDAVRQGASLAELTQPFSASRLDQPSTGLMLRPRDMNRFTLPEVIRLLLVALGVFSMAVGALLTIMFLISWRTSEGTVESSEEVVQGKTNLIRTVRYTRINAVQTFVPFAEETLPPTARPGDHVKVVYMPSSKSAVVYTFSSVWGVPASATALGLVLASLGLFTHRRDPVVEG